MNVIDAFWEKRNLGVSCKEIIISEGDTLEDIKLLKPEIENIDYVVAKVPPAKFEIIAKLHEMGFVFIEASLGVTRDLKNVEPPGLMNRMNKEITYEKMLGRDIDKLYVELNKNLFETDRIFLDPNFGKDQAAHRYICWIKDELNKGADVFNISYKHNKIGFFVFKELGNNVCYPFLASLYDEYKSTGMGFSVIQKPIEEAKRRNCKLISTYISSNNMPIFKLHVALGFKPDKISYVLVKHKQ
jgi:hypothetical protein